MARGSVDFLGGKMSKNHEVEATYRNGSQAPVTVMSDSGYAKPVRGRGCIYGLGLLEILLGLAIISLEAACVGLWYFPEASAVGIYVGIFSLITGIVTVLAAKSGSSGSDGKRKCCFISDVIMSLLCAVKAFALFCASAALLAMALTWYYNIRNGGLQSQGQTGQQNSAQNFFANPFANIFNNVNNYPNPALYGTYSVDRVTEMAGLKAAVMTLYFILFITAVISSGFGCWNCCRHRKERQMVMTVYPNRQQTVGQEKM